MLASLGKERQKTELLEGARVFLTSVLTNFVSYTERPAALLYSDIAFCFKMGTRETCSVLISTRVFSRVLDTGLIGRSKKSTWSAFAHRVAV